MIKKISFIFFLLLFPILVSSEQNNLARENLVIRQALKLRKSTVGVEAYCVSGLFEVAVEARIYSERPKIDNVKIVGPKLGRLSYHRKKEIPLSMEEGEAYQVSSKGEWLPWTFKSETKKIKGTLTKELFRFKIPWEKVIPGKKYQLWVDIESKTSERNKPIRFKFALIDLADFAPEQNQD